MAMRKILIIIMAAALTAACSPVENAPSPVSTETGAQPVINVHLHTSWAESEDAAYRDEILSEMDENNIVLAFLHMAEPSDVEDWAKAAPGRFIAGPMMPCPARTADALMCFPEQGGWPDKAWLEAGLASGDIGMMGEMLFVYYGLPPADPRMDDYWALAAKYDVPVAVHINRGPPPGAPPRGEGCCPNFDDDIGNPALLRPVLDKHPSLRIYMQHAGADVPPESGEPNYEQETFALMRDYPQVYVDMSITNSLYDEQSHRTALQSFIAAGFGDRIMFGTDNLPAAPIIARLNSFEFLTDEQRSGIMYDNAARFLRLDQAVIDRHYAR